MIEKEVMLQLEKYVEIISKEYNRKIELKKNIVHLEDTNTISLWVRNGELFLPKLAFEVINDLSNNPKFGSNRNHRAYTSDNLIINDNTSVDYIEHTIIKGLTPLEYYLESLLHESFHICGVGDGSAFTEGITEYKARCLASKYNLVTSGCGYPKEVKIVVRMEGILGKDVIDEIMFLSRDEMERYIYINCGEEKAILFKQVYCEMNSVFYDYISKNYNGKNAIYDKAREYEKIDYSNVYRLIEEFERRNNRNK